MTNATTNKATLDQLFAHLDEEMAQSTAAMRIQWLKKLAAVIKAHEHAIKDALHKDLKKHPTEAYITEILPVLTEIQLFVKKLESWMQPNYVANGLMFVGAKAYTQLEAKGKCLIISPWNYPFQLPLIHLIACVAAGNTAILKPSEYTPNTSALLQQIISLVFEENHVALAIGDATIATHLLQLPFDHIHFTGSTKVGKIVMAAAAANLSSCTLELGGKSPVIIDDKCDLDAMAQKLVFGKFVNAGQTCIAPDYVLVPSNRKEAFVAAMCKAITHAFGNDIQASPDLSRIINIANHQRIVQLQKDAALAGANIVFGGEYDVSDLYISPTLITDIPENQAILQEEIFGPLLPIVTFDAVKDAVSFIKKKPKPLAMYLFSDQQKWLDYFKKHTSSGALVVNDVLIHMMHPNLPFGGVNYSGIGQSTGWYGMKDFSHEKPVLITNKLLSPTSKIGFPYNSKIEKWLRFFT